MVLFVVVCLLLMGVQATPMNDDPFQELDMEEFVETFHPLALNVKSFMCNNLINCPKPMNKEKRSDYPDELDCSKKNADFNGCGFCNNTGDCNYNGICSTGQYCICDDEHWGEQCQKTRKDKLTAFMLTLLVGPLFSLPPGAGRFYMGYTGYGVAQIILGLSVWITLIFAFAMIIPGIFHCIFGKTTSSRW